MTPDDVEIIEKTRLYQGFFRVDHYRLKHRLFGGGWSGEMSREIFERRHAVTAILYDPDLDKLVFVEQFRPGAFAALSSPWFDSGFSPWLVEFIAGIIEEGETPEDVARREAVEEAGCEIQELVPVCHYLSSPGGSSESIFVFCGRVDASNAGGVYGLSEEHENMRVLPVPVAEAWQWLESGKFRNAMTLIGMQWFKMNHGSLRVRWRRDEAKPGLNGAGRGP
ncbi:MAG TPA: NUDIX domain-containing protein [Rhodospirillales bacterium]|jgi:ADP-ribose pyrophosphatase|nr:NUDIX domain-containing protein [Rhodospirillales bacterium]